MPEVDPQFFVAIDDTATPCTLVSTLAAVLLAIARRQETERAAHAKSGSRHVPVEVLTDEHRIRSSAAQAAAIV